MLRCVVYDARSYGMPRFQFEMRAVFDPYLFCVMTALFIGTIASELQKPK